MAAAIIRRKENNATITLGQRYRKVIKTLIKYGFEDIVAHPPFNRFIPKSKRLVPLRRGQSVFEFTRYERMRFVCEELGTTFIKFAQVASNRPDLLPEGLIQEFSKFQDQVESIDWEFIEPVIHREFGKAPNDFFEFIDHKPIASGSIAQVYSARLKDGQDVAVKIQRPHIDEIIRIDIVILKKLAHLIEEQFPQYKIFQPSDLVRMFEKSILKEIRFTLEASNMERFKEFFQWDKRIQVPHCLQHYSTDKILCMEFISGIKITDQVALKEIGFDNKKLIKTGIDLYFKQIFEYGFFHADPHPGNFLVIEDGRICFLDFGMMGTIVESDKELLADLFLSIYDQDVQFLKKTLVSFSIDEHIENIKELEYDIQEFFHEYANRDLGEIDGQEIFKGLNSLFFDYKIRVPSNLLLLLKALIIVEGVGLSVDASYDIVGSIEPYIRKLLKKKYSVEKLRKSIFKAAGDFTRLAVNLPDDFESVMRKLREGRLHLEFEHKGLEPLYEKLEIVSNRLSFTLVLVAFIIGSSVFVIAKIPPFVYGVSLFGFIGFIISFFFSLKLMTSILRHGNF